MYSLTEKAGGAFAGVYPDCVALRTYAIQEAQKYLKEYREPIPVQKLASAVSSHRGIIRAFRAELSRQVKGKNK